MEISKTRPVSNSLVFSSLFLSVICFAGLIHVEIELHVHRQMLQVLSEPNQDKIELRNTAKVSDENESPMKMLHDVHSDSVQGGLDTTFLVTVTHLKVYNLITCNKLPVELLIAAQT